MKGMKISKSVTVRIMMKGEKIQKEDLIKRLRSWFKISKKEAELSIEIAIQDGYIKKEGDCLERVEMGKEFLQNKIFLLKELGKCIRYCQKALKAEGEKINKEFWRIRIEFLQSIGETIRDYQEILGIERANPSSEIKSFKKILERVRDACDNCMNCHFAVLYKKIGRG